MANSAFYSAGSVFGVIGLALHAGFDGVAIGVGFQSHANVGLSTTLAVLLHKLPEGMAVFGLLLHAGHSVRRSTWVAIGVAALTPLAALLSFPLLRERLASGQLGLLLGVVAGSFLYVGSTDLLPELLHARRFKNTLACFFGVSIMVVVFFLFH